jgi:Flp pilus assembly protein TadG
MRVFPTASTLAGPNLLSPVSGGSPTKIYSDIGSSQNKEYEFGGQVSTIVDSSNTSEMVGLLFLDQGIAVFDISRSFNMQQSLSGAIDAVNTAGVVPNFSSSMIYFLASASVDDIVDHLAFTRFASGSTAQTAMTFQNVTEINTTNVFVRLGADEFNYSSNPTYTDSNNRIVVIDEGQEETQQSFVFFTTVGLYDANNNLLAVGKTSRPILKDNERDVTLKLRLDY